jgi:predicted protein tyrosine phosphatase
MPFIQNVSMRDIKAGNHLDAGQNSMLIQIVDPAYQVPEPFAKFASRHSFEFLDIEEDGMTNIGIGPLVDMSEFGITQSHADEIVGLLQHALERDMNVIVHCHAGRCRSGAVAEVGIMMGFEETAAYRIPNCFVKKLMMKSLGWTYD